MFIGATNHRSSGLLRSVISRCAFGHADHPGLVFGADLRRPVGAAVVDYHDLATDALAAIVSRARATPPPRVSASLRRA
jgi:hypothetical protein